MNSSRSTHLLVCSNHPFFHQWHSSSGRYVMYGNLIGQLETRHVTASKFQYTPGSLLPHIKPVWYDGAKLGSKSYVAQHIFSQEIYRADEGALLRERIAGASSLVCTGLWRTYTPLAKILHGVPKRFMVNEATHAKISLNSKRDLANIQIRYSSY